MMEHRHYRRSLPDKMTTASSPLTDELDLERRVHLHQQFHRLSFGPVSLVTRSQQLGVLLTRHLPRTFGHKRASPQHMKQRHMSVAEINPVTNTLRFEFAQYSFDFSLL